MEWRPLFWVLLVSALIIHEEWVSSPSCITVPSSTHESDSTAQEHLPLHPDDLKVMMVANLLLLGSDSALLNRLFTDYYMSKFFTVIYIYIIFVVLRIKIEIFLLIDYC